ncbi:hypothetical protein ACHAP7_011942 [Fusarium lateritium]
MDSPNSAPVPSTLYASLVTPNQELYYDSYGSIRFPFQQTAYEPISIEAVHWDDFNFQSLSEAYGDTLSANLDFQHVEPYSNPTQITGLNTLKAVCEGYVFRCIHQAMVKGVEDIACRLDQRIPNVEIVRDDLIASGYRSGQSILLRDNSISNTPVRLMVSCFYHTSTWTSDSLLQEHNPGSAVPLQRLATYCLRARTRYGFIFSSEELVVVRVSSTAACNFMAPCRVEWQSIPWNASGSSPGVLTVKLSLWSLVMMSLHTEYRVICTPERLLPVHLWWRYRNCEGREVFRHHLSMREVFQRPTGAVVQDMSLSL